MKVLVSIVSSCSIFLSGCDPEGTGDVTVRWTVGLTGTCAGADLESVAVHLETNGHAFADQLTAACTDGQVTFVGVPIGDYRAVVRALDLEGVVAYEGSAPVRISGALLASECLVRLAPRPAAIEIQWYFADGRLCSFYGVEDVAVHLFRNDTEVRRRTVSCNDGRTTFESLESDTYALLVEGLDAHGRTTHSFVTPKILLRPGRDMEVTAPLVPCTGWCSRTM